MRDAGLYTASLEVVSALLLFPTALPAPLLDQSFPIALHKNSRFIVVGFEKEWNPNYREAKRSRGAGKRIVQDLFNGLVQMLLPDVPVGSQGVRDEFDWYHQRAQCGGHHPLTQQGGREWTKLGMQHR